MTDEILPPVEKPVSTVTPSTSTVVSTVLAPPVSILLSLALSKWGVPMDETTAAGLGSVVAGLLGAFFKGGRKKDVK